MTGARALPLMAAASTALLICLALAASASRMAEASPSVRIDQGFEALAKSDRLKRPVDAPPACTAQVWPNLSPTCLSAEAGGPRTVRFITVDRQAGTATTILEK